MRRGRHERTSPFTPIVWIVVGIVALVGGGILLWHVLGSSGIDLPQLHIGTADPAGENGESTDPVNDGVVLSEHMTTPSGISCTRRDLGENAIYEGELILVNNETLYHFPDLQQELVSIYDNKTNSYFVRDMEVLLAPVALDALNQMLDDFRTQGGSRTVNVVAGYRTEEFQQHLFEQSADRNGQDHAEQFVAQPGGSEHHTGYAVDLSIFNSEDGTSRDYDGSGEYAWINENCQNYGYIVRYATDKAALTGISDEPWHFRYVGVPHATEIVNNDFCLEEYIDYLHQFPFEGEHLSIRCETGTYEVWYCEGHESYIPDTGEYQVSGNNVDGIIVTCKR